MNNNETIRHGRFISFSCHDAATNMAIDEAILEAHLKGLVPPTLRIYQFTPPALSLGYAQHLAPEVVDNIAASGIPIVRRPTGGRAVLHDNDLTYSFVASSASQDSEAANGHALLSQALPQAYAEICQGLINAFTEFGITLELGQSKSRLSSHQDCFATTTISDLHYQGKKLIGSAQIRRKHGVLQHGSIILNQPQELMGALLSSTGEHDPSSNKESKTADRHANLFEILGETASIDRLQSALKSGFEKAFSKHFVPGGLSQAEWALVEQLKPKYVSWY